MPVKAPPSMLLLPLTTLVALLWSTVPWTLLVLVFVIVVILLFVVAAPPRDWSNCSAAMACSEPNWLSSPAASAANACGANVQASSNSSPLALIQFLLFSRTSYSSLR